MKRSTVLMFLAGISLMHSSAYAVTDLPDPTGAVVAAASTISAEQGFVGIAQVKSMSRVAGGTTYRVNLKESQSLMSLQISSKAFRVKINQVSVVTDDGATVQVKAFKGQLLSKGESMASEKLNQSDRVKTIVIQAEAYDGEASMDVKVVADRRAPVLSLDKDEVSATTSRVRLRANHEVLVLEDSVLKAGKVVAVFEGDKVGVKLTSGKTEVYQRSNVLARISSFEGLADGRPVIIGRYSYDQKGDAYVKSKILAVYETGAVAAKFTSTASTNYIKNSSVGVAEGCNSYGYCVGQYAVAQVSGFNPYRMHSVVVKIVGHNGRTILVERENGAIKAYDKAAITKEKR